MVVPPWESKQNGSVNPMKIGMRWDEHQRSDGKATHVWKNMKTYLEKQKVWRRIMAHLHDDPSFCSLPATNLQTRSLIPWERSQKKRCSDLEGTKKDQQKLRLEGALKSLKKLHKNARFRHHTLDTFFFGLPRKRPPSKEPWVQRPRPRRPVSSVTPKVSAQKEITLASTVYTYIVYYPLVN